jgi:phosphoenolpyruvate carboxylase
VRLDSLLDELDDPNADAVGPGARSRTDLAEEVTMLWQTDEIRPHRPRVVDEIRHGLWIFEESLLDAAPALVGDLRQRLPTASAPLRFGSWIGGDQDGNPNAGPATIDAALAAPGSSPRSVPRRGAELGVELGLASTLVRVSDELAASLARDERQSRATQPEIGERNADEPYRRKLSFVWHRLGRRSRAGPTGTRRPRSSSPTSTSSTRASRANRGDGSPRAAGGAAPAGRAVRVPLAKLDVRLHADAISAPPRVGPSRPLHGRSSATASRRWTRS